MSERATSPSRGRRRLAAALAGSLAILAPLGWMWWDSILPGSYAATQMGYVDTGVPGGGTSASGHGGHAAVGSGGVPVASLTGPGARKPAVRLTLSARQQRVTLGPGVTVDAITLNGTTPGPTIEATQGDLVEVTLVNEGVPDGITLHWHGVDVPNAEDGVAGVTQDAVHPGEKHTYRFVAEDAGTYWYHSHQVSHEQVKRGLLGALVVNPAAVRGGASGAVPPVDHDVLALTHLYGPRKTINGRPGETRVDAAVGDTVRVRVINTDAGPLTASVTGAAYRVVAVDGTDVNAPTDVAGKGLIVTAGARADLGITVPEGGVRVDLGGASLVLGDGNPGLERAKDFVDLLSYGSPMALDLDPGKAERSFDYVIGRRPGFVAGRPGMQWTINGHLYPDVPMFMVAEGEVVTMRIVNDSGEVHPMHLHGHHVVVLSRDGKEATGSPWWVDSLNVEAGEEYEVAFVADNPGIWMDHCHNLPHAKEGLVAHLMYEGVAPSFQQGSDTGNSPE